MLKYTEPPNLLACQGKCTCSLLQLGRWGKNGRIENTLARGGSDPGLAVNHAMCAWHHTSACSGHRNKWRVGKSHSRPPTGQGRLLTGHWDWGSYCWSTAAKAAQCLRAIRSHANLAGGYCTCFLVLVFPVLSLMYLAINSFLPARKKNL